MRGIVKRVLQIVVGKLFFLPFYAARNSWAVWYYVLNKKGRNLHRTCNDALNAVEKRVADDLSRDGIALVHIDELFPETSVFRDLKAYTDKILPSARVMEEKDFNLELWPENGTLDFQNPFVRFALDDRILKIAGAYLGVWGKMFYYSLWLTRVIPKDSPRFRSQNWHRDPDDKRMCKMFLYLKDIDNNSGPFQYIKGSQCGGRWSHVAPQRPPKGSYPPQGEVERSVAPEDITVCTGQAGTIIFADTAGLHRGGYATESERLMSTAEYSSNATFRPPRFTLPKNFNALQATLSPRAKYALDRRLGVVAIFNRLSDLSRRYDLY